MLGNQGTFLCCVDSRLGSFGGHLAHGLISDAVLGWLYIGRGGVAGPPRAQGACNHGRSCVVNSA